MIPRGSRLERTRFRALQREGQRMETSFFIVFITPSQQPSIGVVVSQAVSKKASERNRIRRAARSFFVDYIKNSQNDMLVTAKKEAQGVSSAVLISDLKSELNK